MSQTERLLLRELRYFRKDLKAMDNYERGAFWFAMIVPFFNGQSDALHIFIAKYIDAEKATIDMNAANDCLMIVHLRAALKTWKFSLCGGSTLITKAMLSRSVKYDLDHKIMNYSNDDKKLEEACMESVERFLDWDYRSLVKTAVGTAEYWNEKREKA